MDLGDRNMWVQMGTPAPHFNQRQVFLPTRLGGQQPSKFGPETTGLKGLESGIHLKAIYIDLPSKGCLVRRNFNIL